MAHFVENLSFYIMFEVLERCWSRFQEEVAQARDLDALITSHEAFLDNVMRASLLDDSSEALRVRGVFFFFPFSFVFLFPSDPRVSWGCTSTFRRTNWTSCLIPS